MDTIPYIETAPQYSGVFNFIYFLVGLSYVWSDLSKAIMFFFEHVHSIASALGFIIHSHWHVHSYLFPAV